MQILQRESTAKEVSFDGNNEGFHPQTHHEKELLKRFHLNGNTIGFHA